MDDLAVCKWVVEQRSQLKKFTDQAAGQADPKRQEVFKKLLSVNNAMVELFWEINIARDREQLQRIVDPN
ncbi:hypothetical protein ES703_00384 [subsurface metagenome]